MLASTIPIIVRDKNHTLLSTQSRITFNLKLPRIFFKLLFSRHTILKTIKFHAYSKNYKQNTFCRSTENRRPSTGGGGRGGRETSFSAFPEPPTGFMDHPQALEMSEAECDMDTLRRIKLRNQQQLDPKMSIPQGEAHRNFSITV